MSVFNINRSEVFLGQLQDSGVAGATLSVKMHGTHVFFEMKSANSVSAIITNNLDDIRLLRKALKKAESIFNEVKQAEKEQRTISRTSAEISVARHRQENKDKEKAKGKRAKNNSTDKPTRKYT